MMTPDTNVLTPLEQRAWQHFAVVIDRLPAELDSRLLQECGLTHFQTRLLEALSAVSEQWMQLSDLADRLACSLSRLSHVVVGLERLGFVERRKMPAGRGIRAVLTDAGAAKADEVWPVYQRAVWKLVFRGLTPREIETLVLIMAGIRNDLTGAPYAAVAS